MSRFVLSSRLSAAALAFAVAACARPATTPAEDAGASIPASLPLKWDPRPTSASITATDLMTRMYIVADDSMEGRAAGTAGGVRATDYIAAELRRMGVEPAGENGGYFQTIPLMSYGLDSSLVQVGDERLVIGTDVMPFLGVPQTTRGAFISFARATNAPVVYGGIAGDTATMITAEKAAGAVVVIAPPLDSTGKPTSNIGAAFAPIAERYARAAVVVMATLDLYPNTPPSAFIGPTRTMTNPNRVTTGRPGLFFASTAGAAKLLGVPLAQAKRGHTGKPATISITFAEKPLDTPARNVIGVIRGSDPAVRGQYVGLGAHNDHVGVRAGNPVDHDSLKAFNRVLRPEGAEESARPATPEDIARIRFLIDSMRALRPPRPDSIFNGADDDGSGTVTLLEVAEAIVAQPTKPKRSILFVWHTAEELGLHGARYFTSNPTVPRDSIVASINMDMVGRGEAEDTKGGGPNYLQLLGSRRLSTEFGNLVDSLATRPPHGFELDYQFDAPGHPNQFYCRSDHAMYARFGIPIVFFSTGGHQDYHMPTDEPQYIRYPHLVKVTRLVRDLAVHVANLDHRVVVDQPKPDPNAPCRQ